MCHHADLGRSKLRYKFVALYGNVCKLLNGHVANGAAELFGFPVGKLKMFHEGLPGLYEDRATVSEDEGDSDDVVIDISSFPASPGEGLSEVPMLLRFEGLGSRQVKVTAKSYF